MINRFNFQRLSCNVTLFAVLPLLSICSKDNSEFQVNPGKCKSELMCYQDASGKMKPVKKIADWEKKRTLIIEGMESAMGKVPEIPVNSGLDVQFTDSLKKSNYTRYTICFLAAENERVPAYLYLPANIIPGKKLPAMVVLHGTGELGKRLVDGESTLPNRAQARELAERGYVVIAPDYPSMGDLKDYNFGTDRYVSGTMKGIFDHIRCVDLLVSLKEVDPERIGVLGHSLGGHNAIFAGAFDKRLKVVVSSSGWTLMDYYDIGEAASIRHGGKLGPWAQDRYMPLLRDRYNLDPARIPFDFDEAIAAIAPRAFFSNSPVNDSNFNVEGVRKGIASVSVVYEFFNSQGNLQVRYPLSGHDFPPETRLEAYQFIDRILKHIPNVQTIE